MTRDLSSDWRTVVQVEVVPAEMANIEPFTTPLTDDMFVTVS